MKHKVFDYIVVGSGPAGSALASKLSEKYTVLLLEAGENNDNDELIKSATSNIYDHLPDYFWQGESIPQKHVNGKSFALTGGRLAGGGSSVNGEMYVRPSPFVLREWEKVGGAIWSPEKVQSRFIEMERFIGDMENLEVHGYEGKLNIRQTFIRNTGLIDNLTQAISKATGIPVVEDYNDPATPIGAFGRWQLYQKPDGERASASVCFLLHANSENLAVHYQSTVTKVLFNENKEATGVSFVARGEGREAYAKRRVIVCAGVHSAKILMLSGIGPEAVLKAAGVPVLHANPNVGCNLADDSFVSTVFSIKPGDYDDWRKADPNGRLAGGAFLPNPLHDSFDGQRSIELISTQVMEGFLYLSVMCLTPKSRGTLTIQSNDPLKVMKCDFGFLSDPDDMKLLVAAVRKYIVPIGRALHDIDPAYALVAPSPDIIEDDAKLEEYIRSSFIHTYHDQCALKMGTEDSGGVVNGYGEVYGVKNISVADASIIPYHVDGNTSAAAYVIGYTIADHLLS